MLKKTPSVVLALLRSSTYRSVRLASSLAAALLDSLFEHPDMILALDSHKHFQAYCRHHPIISAAYYVGQTH